MAKVGGYHKPWTDEENETLVQLYKQNKSNQQIADDMGKTWAAVKSQVSKVQKMFNLPLRDKRLSYEKRRDYVKTESEFDKQWHGVVPCGHWTITKPWGKA